VNFQKFFKKQIFAFGMIAGVLSAIGFAQNSSAIMSVPKKEAPKPTAVAGRTNLYCAGYIQQSAISTGNRIVGGVNESDGYNYGEKDYVYINMGSDKGVNVGDVFAVVRPKGRVDSRWTSKKDIGFYVQEVGALEVVRVKGEVSVARVKTSCDSFLLGDLVQLSSNRISPLSQTRPALDLFADPSGKARGRILMARDGAEMLSRDFVAYVDLGVDDNVQIGDRLTVYRPLEMGNPLQYPQKEAASARDEGYQSDEYRGGKFSNQTSRKSGDKADGRVVTTAMAKEGRPDLRKIVGEAVVLNVKERSATIVITRTAQEIHTGDWVEIQ